MFQAITLIVLLMLYVLHVLHMLCYAIPAWGPFVSADLWQKIKAFLKRSWRYGFTTSICDVQALLDSAMHDLFVMMQDPDHSLHQLLPPVRSTTNSLRERGHNFELYEYNYKFFRPSFLVNCLFKFL